MNFKVKCSCGLSATVSEAAAGGKVDCPCGRIVSVPSWKELRISAGLPPYNVSPELVVENLMRTGELPFDERCLSCEEATDELVYVRATCEKSWTKEEGGLSLGALIVVALVSPVLAFLRPRGEERTYGKDKIYRLPLRVCSRCRPTLRSQTDIKQCLRAVPAYDMLLEKFPDADVGLM